MKKFVKIASIPLILLACTLVYSALWRIFNLPKDDELISLITNFFNKYGLWIVFVSSVVEAALIIGNYFPGGVVVFLGVISAGNNIPRIIATVAVVIIGFFLGYTLNYFMGKYGWYRLLARFGMKEQIEKSKTKLTKHSLNAIFISYWEPNLGSVTATAAGILNINFVKFSLQSLLGLVVWDTFWGALVASLGKQALNLATNLVYILPIVAIWIVILLIRHKYKNETPS